MGAGSFQEDHIPLLQTLSMRSSRCCSNTAERRAPKEPGLDGVAAARAARCAFAPILCTFVSPTSLRARHAHQLFDRFQLLPCSKLAKKELRKDPSPDLQLSPPPMTLIQVLSTSFPVLATHVQPSSGSSRLQGPESRSCPSNLASRNVCECFARGSHQRGARLYALWNG